MTLETAQWRVHIFSRVLTRLYLQNLLVLVILLVLFEHYFLLLGRIPPTAKSYVPSNVKLWPNQWNSTARWHKEASTSWIEDRLNLYPSPVDGQDHSAIGLSLSWTLSAYPVCSSADADLSLASGSLARGHLAGLSSFPALRCNSTNTWHFSLMWRVSHFKYQKGGRWYFSLASGSCFVDHVKNLSFRKPSMQKSTESGSTRSLLLSTWWRKPGC